MTVQGNTGGVYYKVAGIINHQKAWAVLKHIIYKPSVVVCKEAVQRDFHR